MLTFWQGAGAALLGAIVGGSFTAYAALLQAKASMNAVKYELRETFAHEQEERQKMAACQAVDRALAVLSDLDNLMIKIGRLHDACEPRKCARRDIPVRELEGLLRRLRLVSTLYFDSSWPTLEGHSFVNIDDELDWFLTASSVDDLPNWQVDKGREFSYNGARYECGYSLAAAYIEVMGTDYRYALSSFRASVGVDGSQ
jgi:hypothetical protein